MKVQIQKRTIIKLVSVLSMFLVVLSFFPVNAFAAMSNDDGVTTSFVEYKPYYYATDGSLKSCHNLATSAMYKSVSNSNNFFSGVFHNAATSLYQKFVTYYYYSLTVSTSGTYNFSYYLDSSTTDYACAVINHYLGTSSSRQYDIDTSVYVYKTGSSYSADPNFSTNSLNGKAQTNSKISLEADTPYTVCFAVTSSVSALARVNFDSEFSIKAVSDDTTPGIDSRTTDAWVLSSIDSQGRYWYRYNGKALSCTTDDLSVDLVSGSSENTSHNYSVSWNSSSGVINVTFVAGNYPSAVFYVNSVSSFTPPGAGVCDSAIYYTLNYSNFYSGSSSHTYRIGNYMTSAQTISSYSSGSIIDSLISPYGTTDVSSAISYSWKTPNISALYSGTAIYCLVPYIIFTPTTATTINNYDTTYTITNNNTYNTQNIFNTTENKAYYDIDNNQYCTYTNYYYDTDTYTYYYADDNGDYGSTTYTDNSTVTYYYDNSTGDTVTNVYYYNEYNYSDDSGGSGDNPGSGDSGNPGDTDDIIIDDSNPDNPFSLTSLIKALLNFFVVVLKGFWKIISGVLDTIISSVGTFFDSFSGTGVFQFFNGGADLWD